MEGDFIKEKKMLKTIIHIGIFVFLMVLIFGLYFWIISGIVLKGEFKELPAEGNMVYQVDSIREEKGEIILDGFIFKKNISTNTKGKWVVFLHDMESGKNIRTKTKRIVRDDVNEYFKCEYDFSNSGFSASVNKKLIDMNQGKYQVYLYYTDEDIKSSGNVFYYALEEYLIDGKLFNLNILENKPFDFSGTELNTILQEAELRVCRPEYGMCVYQTDGDFYWVVDESFSFSENGNTYIQFQMNTTQPEQLPAERLSRGWRWGNLGFYFEQNEIKGEFGDFRVAKESIPEDYSVTNIWTGIYKDSKWIWEQHFFMEYRLLWNK